MSRRDLERAAFLGMSLGTLVVLAVAVAPGALLFLALLLTHPVAQVLILGIAGTLGLVKLLDAQDRRERDRVRASRPTRRGGR